MKIQLLFRIIMLVAALGLSVSPFCARAKNAASPPASTILLIKKYPITVDGHSIKAFRIEQPDGSWGFHGIKGQYFDAIVKNQTDEPTSVHWHGLIVPNNQDGVPYVTQQPIPPGGQHHYHFKLKQSGTYWMHSHFGLQVQQYLSAPLVISDPGEKPYDKEVIMFLADFSTKKPQTILDNLHHSMANMGSMHTSAPDLNDVAYDAYLTNYRTLKDPEVIRVQPGNTVRLRVIDGAAATNFWVNTGTLPGTLIAADGELVQPLTNSQFQIAIGQRIDILVKIPPGTGAYPILAQGEGVRMQTGVILATPGAKIPSLSEQAAVAAPALNHHQESQLIALHPLPALGPVQTLRVKLEGDMMNYVWKINGQTWPNITPLMVKPNHRVEIVFNNQTNMAHPMHLHGHVFEVTALDGHPVKHGALHDTILVLPHSTVKVQFDTDNPGHWMLHCHMLYHQESGMMTLMDYPD